MPSHVFHSSQFSDFGGSQCKLDRNKFRPAYHTPGDMKTKELPFPYPCKSKAYSSYKDAGGNVMEASFVIKLQGCYLFCYYVRELSHPPSPTLFHVFCQQKPSFCC